MVRDGALESSVGEHIEIFADRLIVVGAHDDIRAAGAGLQTGIEWRANIRTRIEVDGSAIMTGWKFDAELDSQIVRRQQSLISAYESHVAEA